MISVRVLKRVCLLLMVIGCFLPLKAQKLITYEAGMGSRNPGEPDVWVLYHRVKAMHEGMVLHADSALLNTVQNDFTAFRNIKIELTDTTTIYGDRLYYDANSRVVDIWADTVIFIDGKTVLKTNHLSYDRNTSTASYNNWGYTTNEDKRMVSRVGEYNSDTKIFFIYEHVELTDSASRLVTDTLQFNTNNNLAEFFSPTYIYSDTTTIYSERGSYNTDTRYALSTKASKVQTGEKLMTCDTLHYYKDVDYGMAIGNVVLFDTLNDVTCTGRYCETDQRKRTSFVTDSALVIYVDKGDSLFVHADSLFVANDSARQVQSLCAYRHVKIYRNDAQGMCDSAFYSVADSLMQLYYDPVLWYDSYQCSADTIQVYHDTAGLRVAYLDGNGYAVEQVDAQKHNQLKGKRMIVYFKEGNPDYSDVIGNAEMVYYITEEQPDSTFSLVGVNVGIGSSMRIYMEDNAPSRVVTQGNPDMYTYPLNKLPEDRKQLVGFRWLDNRRPHNRHEVFVW